MASSMKSTQKVLLILGTATVALGGATISEAAPKPGHAQACVPRTNVEAIVDDSLSMADTDPQRLRVQAMDLLVDNPFNAKLTLGAIEFFGEALTLFDPQLVGQNRAAMKSAFDTRITNSDSATDYNAAFAAAGAHNPNANARIFLTDGGHLLQEGDYAEGHRGGPPTHVIALASETYLQPGSADEARLQRIAAETGGSFRRADEPVEIQQAATELTSRLNCLPQPASFTNTFTRTGQTKTRKLAVRSGVRSVTFTLSWADPNARFALVAPRVVRRGKTVAVASKPRRLSLTRRSGDTYLTVKLSGLVRGKLRYGVRAKQLGFSSSRVELTTQALRSNRR
jgi:hypothetical protein